MQFLDNEYMFSSIFGCMDLKKKCAQIHLTLLFSFHNILKYPVHRNSDPYVQPVEQFYIRLGKNQLGKHLKLNKKDEGGELYLV